MPRIPEYLLAAATAAAAAEAAEAAEAAGLLLLLLPLAAAVADWTFDLQTAAECRVVRWRSP